MRLSASKVDTFLGCRRLFKYRYVKKPPIIVPENKAFLLGNVTHGALERYHADGERSFKPGEAMGRAFRLSAEKEHATERLPILLDAKEMLVNYIKWDRKQAEPPKRDLERSIKFTVDGISISGRVDRIDYYEDTVVIVDYKTNQHVPSTTEISESVQLPIYAAWLQSLGESRSIKMQYLFLKHLKKPSASRLFPATASVVEEVKDKFRLVYRALSDWDARRNQKYKYCLNCDYRAYCFNDNDNRGLEK